MQAPASVRQIGAIHAIAARIGLDEDARRDVIAGEADGKRSSKELSAAEAGRVIERLKALSIPVQSGVNPSLKRASSPLPRARGALRLDGPYAPKLRALWISGWNLGRRARSRRQGAARLSRTADRDCAYALAARAGRRREKRSRRSRSGWRVMAAVKWPGARSGVTEVKRAILDAQCARLAALGETPVVSVYGRDLDQIAQTLGEQLRAAAAPREAPHGS